MNGTFSHQFNERLYYAEKFHLGWSQRCCSDSGLIQRRGTDCAFNIFAVRIGSFSVAVGENLKEPMAMSAKRQHEISVNYIILSDGQCKAIPVAYMTFSSRQV